MDQNEVERNLFARPKSNVRARGLKDGNSEG